MTILSNAMSLYKSQSLNAKPLQLNTLTLVDGSSHQFSKAKPTLVHYWATWCPTCKLEAANIDLLSNYFEVVSIVVKSGSDEEIKQWMSERNYNFKVVNDENGFLSNAAQISAFPTTFIYDKDKKLIFSDVGYSSTFSMFLKLLWAK